jgi:hypothetical protein
VRATVHRVYPGFDPETRKIAVDLAVADRPGGRGGLRAELTLEVPDPAGGVLLPRGAVTERYEQHWVRRDDGTQVQVVLLGNHGGPEGDLLRVASPQWPRPAHFALQRRSSPCARWTASHWPRRSCSNLVFVRHRGLGVLGHARPM